MGEAWLKLYKKIGEHEIIADHTALALFIWLLTHVKQDGTVRVSRFYMAGILNIKPGTYYDALMRLVKTYKVATARPTPHYTIITLIHWAKYQSRYGDTNTSTNNAPTPDQHLTNTIYKNKEIRIKNNSISQNEIIEDPDFKRLLSIKGSSDDSTLRMKMSLEQTLEKRYPAWKYQSQWRDAMDYRKQRMN